MARHYFIRNTDGAFVGVADTEQTPPAGATAVLESTILDSGTVPRNRIRSSDGRWLNGAYVEGPSSRPLTPEQHAEQNPKPDPDKVDPEFRRQYDLLMAEDTE